MSGEGANGDDVLDDRSAAEPVDNSYADAFEFHLICSGRRAIDEFLIDLGLFKSSLLGNFS